MKLVMGPSCSVGALCKRWWMCMQDFRGRDPSTEPLLRHNDLLPAAA